MSSEEVAEIFQLLRDTLGRKVPKHNEVSIGVLEKKKQSVQGIWRNPHSLIRELVPDMNKTVERRHKDYGLQVLLDDIGTAGVIRMTQKLLRRRAESDQAIIDALPKKEVVRATE